MEGNVADQWGRLASDIEIAVEEAYKQLRHLSEDTLEVRPHPDAWSVKEILGHIWIVADDKSITLGELMIDYLRHLKDHLLQMAKPSKNMETDRQK